MTGEKLDAETNRGNASDGTNRIYTADEVRKILDRLHDEQITHTENVPETVEVFAEEVVEEGDISDRPWCLGRRQQSCRECNCKSPSHAIDNLIKYTVQWL